jgi:hypothetical protein
LGIEADQGAGHPFKAMLSILHSEGPMHSNELYFLIFVCGSFGALSLALALNTIRYHRWRKLVARAVQ